MWNPASESPSWRYNTATDELARESKGLPVIAPCQDPAVQHLKEFLRLVGSRRMDLQHMNRVFGPLAHTLMWHKDTRPEGMKDSIEALVLAKVDMDFMRAHFAPDIDRQSLRMYCLFYFDVAPYMDGQMWMERNVFSPNEGLEGKRRNSAYLWKLIAYHGGGTKLLQAAVAGKAMETETLEWMKEFCVNTKVRDLAKAITSLGRMHVREKSIPYLDVTRKWMDTAKGLMMIGAPAEQEGSVRDVLAGQQLGKSLKSNRKEDTLSGEETCDTEKFNDGDFKND